MLILSCGRSSAARGMHDSHNSRAENWHLAYGEDHRRDGSDLLKICGKLQQLGNSFVTGNDYDSSRRSGQEVDMTEVIRQRKDLIMHSWLTHLQVLTQSLNKLIECQIVDNCKKGLGYEKYNAVPPPYTRNFMPLTLDLSFTGLDEFVNKLVVENSKAISSEEEPKVVRKNDDAPIIEEWVSDDKEEDVTQHKKLKSEKQLGIVLI
ncbi:hypothetical protein Tco_0595835 [Tanacetum coccineum]